MIIMKPTCPVCRNPLEEYHQFCPGCGFDFPREKEKEKPANSKAGENKSSTCPSCGKPIEGHNEYCPWCDICLRAPVEETSRTAGEEIIPDSRSNGHYPSHGSHTHPNEEPDAAGAEGENSVSTRSDDLLICPGCGNFNAVDFKVCNKCGAPLRGVSPTPGTIPRMLQRREGFDAPVLPLAHYEPRPVQTTKWECDEEPPVSICFNFGKRYRKKLNYLLEFRIENRISLVIDKITMTARGSLIENPLEEKTVAPVSPGSARDLRVAGFRPLEPGCDELRLSIRGEVGETDDFHLLGSVPLVVSEKKELIQNVNVSISSQGDLYAGDLEIDRDLLPDDRFEDDEQPIEMDRWNEIELFWDREKQERESNMFPPACIDDPACGLDRDLISSIAVLSPENAPRAACSTEQGESFTIVPGSTLLLGRNPKTNHVPLNLFPERHHTGENLRISRNHCRIFIRNNRVFIRDTSSTGVFLENERLPAREDAPLASGERLLFANNLELRITIYTDGKKIIAVGVRRINNATNKRCILARGPAPIGGGPDLPIHVIDAPDFYGAVYYHPFSRSWRLRSKGAPPDGLGDMKLEKFQELICGTRKLWFSII